MRYTHDHSSLSFTFQTKAISSNHAIKRTRAGISFPSKELKKFKNDLEIVLASKQGGIDIFKTYITDSTPIFVKIIFRISGHLTKKKTINKRGGDLDNMIKYTIDVLFKYIQINDAQITCLYAEKMQDEKDSIEITISV